MSIKKTRDQSLLCYCHKAFKALCILGDQECLPTFHLKGKEIQAFCLEENHTVLHCSKKPEIKDGDKERDLVLQNTSGL